MANCKYSSVKKFNDESGFNEVNDEKICALNLFKELIPTKPDIDFQRTDDAFILRFLRARKFHIHHAFELFCRYYEYRKKYEDLFYCFNTAEPQLQQALLDGFPGVLESADSSGRRIIIIFTANWDPNRYSLLSIFRAILLSLETLLEEEESQINGFVMIVDWSEFSFKIIVEGLQDSFPARFAGIHFVNQPWFVEAAINLIRTFLKERTKEKLILHGNNLSNLHNYISQDILPSELGGNGPAYNNQYWAKKLIEQNSCQFSNHPKLQKSVTVDAERNVGKMSKKFRQLSISPNSKFFEVN